MSTKMKIGEIRAAIRGSMHTRNWLTGGTSEEFRRQQVGPALQAKIVELEALQIPERFAADRLQRDEEIGYCRNVIARWEAAQVKPAWVPPARCNAGGTVHVYLGGMTCVLCSAPFVSTSTH
jgi:hypothetical protein